ncbi:MAG: hypothetical protein FJ050_11155 [Cyanobacteria bacterium M_surface_7_m2_040]|nr:hypothetical protein [Cyanobacteria bacterium M_surface_7_m2_040]
MVVSVSDLTCLDYLQWWRTGERAASALSMSQSTVSRKSNRALAQLQPACARNRGEWAIEGDTELLAMARALHQHHRW